MVTQVMASQHTEHILFVFSQVKQSMQLNSQFPIAEFSVAIGFFLVLILEQLMLDCKESSSMSTSVADLLSAEYSAQERQHLLRRHESISEDRHKSEPHPALRTLLLVAALSLHSLFEGLAVGLQPSPGSLLQITAAVTLHKAVVAFSLGLSIARTEVARSTTMWSSFIFSVMSPVGIGIGLGVSQFGSSTPTVITTAVLEGLACGTFVYVTFFEVLPHELKSSIDRKLKLLMVIVGFTVVCGLLFLDL
ncbi:hypothetical protein PR048_018784 [Dryococelus australis]|uniref:Zinc transporter ZIP1 n=1 Tax=Dryococelus australis TaxID=614101 RepID=A0ABQ9H1P0_9NEOP|nr:hypothetical protein PR048_018784 [Dryococelus australis]